MLIHNVQKPRVSKYLPYWFEGFGQHVGARSAPRWPPNPFYTHPLLFLSLSLSISNNIYTNTIGRLKIMKDTKTVEVRKIRLVKKIGKTNNSIQSNPIHIYTTKHLS